MEVNYQDLDGNPHSITGTMLFGRILLHEIDHLNGTEYVDHVEGPDKLFEVAKEEKEGE